MDSKYIFEDRNQQDMLKNNRMCGKEESSMIQNYFDWVAAKDC